MHEYLNVLLSVEVVDLGDFQRAYVLEAGRFEKVTFLTEYARKDLSNLREERLEIIKL